ncbi:uncharacterized protein LOC111351319 isoform X7 [Spodoptera litura]|uniref:Uncharacterized protein LOC111351319 isoform X7 n=1 Tax=Spodoptera litura TaxID=69820 RepID=A0A9J7IN56_SPOLT|nr:uncharacterized protein LOC111351319 isoform X7 [Spodoptera litura]
MPFCSVLECKNDSSRKNRNNGGVSYHRFPDDPIFKEKWINATGRLTWFPTKNSTICSQHFKDEDFTIKKSGNRYLKDKTVPTRNVSTRILLAVQDHGARKTGNILCPNCNTEIQIPQNKEDKVNAMIVNVYQYFAKEGTGLTGAQLRQRTALCTGASEADVECALVLEHEKSTDEGNPAMSQNPPRKRRRKGSESPPPEQEEEPYVEQETLIVKIEPNADDGSNEINPLAIDEETPPYSMTEPGHICLKDGSCCNPLQIQPNVINAATVFVKEEPKEETNADQPVANISLPVHACDSDSSDAPSDQAMSQSYQPKQSDNKGPTPDNPLDSCSHIKTEEINIEDSCCSDTDSEGYS